MDNRIILPCDGVIGEDEGTVDAPIGRHPVDRKKMSINYKNGKHAVTHYRVLERFKQFTYVECQLETGRTHQICVQRLSLKLKRTFGRSVHTVP